MQAVSDDPSPIFSTLIQRRCASGARVLGVLSKRSYVVQDGKCELSPVQSPLEQEPSFGKSGRLIRDTDLMLGRLQTDVVIEGFARSFSPCTSFDLGLRFGEHRARMTISGPREAYRDAQGRLRFRELGLADKVRMSWDLAYGGVDQAHTRRCGDLAIDLARALGRQLPDEYGVNAYPRNPFGKGYCFGLEAQDTVQLPQIEHPAHRVRPENLLRSSPDRWPLAPLAACTSPMAYTMFPRCCDMGAATPDYDHTQIPARAFPELSQGLVSAKQLEPNGPLPNQLSNQFSQCASPSLRFGQIEAGMPIQIDAMHPEHAHWSFTLPQEIPRMGLAIASSGVMQPSPVIASLWIDVEKSRVEVLWVAEQRIQGQYGQEELRRAEFGVKW